MKLVSIVKVHRGQHTENISLDHSYSHLENTDGHQGGGTENTANSTADSSACQHLGAEVGDDVKDHVSGCQVSSKTNSERDGPGEERDLQIGIRIMFTIDICIIGISKTIDHNGRNEGKIKQ